MCERPAAWTDVKNHRPRHKTNSRPQVGLRYTYMPRDGTTTANGGNLAAKMRKCNITE